jgi:hypothetical protein
MVPASCGVYSTAEPSGLSGSVWIFRSYIGYEELTISVLAAGRALGVEIMIVECRSDRDFEMAVAKMVDAGVGAMAVGALALTNLDKIVSLAALHKLPAI